MKKNYSELLLDPRWQRKRLEVLNRDNFTCVKCGNDKKTLHVHHKSYKGKPWEVELKELETVCADCHKKEHQEEFTYEHELHEPVFIATHPKFFGYDELLNFDLPNRDIVDPENKCHEFDSKLQFSCREILKYEKISLQDYKKTYMWSISKITLDDWREFLNVHLNELCLEKKIVIHRFPLEFGRVEFDYHLFKDFPFNG